MTTGTRTLVVQWSALVTRADPNWQRDLKVQPDEWAGIEWRGKKAKNLWQTRGPYDGTHDED